MGKHTHATVLLLAVFFGFTVHAFGQESRPLPRVAVVGFENATGSPSFDAACSAVTETLILTLRSIGTYDVEPVSDVRASGDDAGRAVLAVEHGSDYLIYGSMTSSSDAVVCALSVFDRAKGKTSITKRSAPVNLLEIFDTADEQVASVLEAMTGVHIAFGSVTFGVSGEAGSYSVLLDGLRIGSNLNSIDKVLIGRHTVSVVQKRMMGDVELVHRAVDIREGKTVKVDFTIPYLMDAEKKRIDDAERSIRGQWDDPQAVSALDAKCAEFSALLSDVSYSPRLAEFRDRARQLGAEWAIRKVRLSIEESAWTPRFDALDSTTPLYLDASGYPDGDTIRKAFVVNATLLATLFELHAGNAIAAGDYAGALEDYESILVFSRFLRGDRLSEYAYATAALSELAGQPASERKGPSEKAKKIFASRITAGKRFFELAGSSPVLVASDFSLPVSVDGGGFDSVPRVLTREGDEKSIVALPAGYAPSDAVSLPVGSGSAIVFLDDGFSRFASLYREPLALPTVASVSTPASVSPVAAPVAAAKPAGTAKQEAPQRPISPDTRILVFGLSGGPVFENPNDDGAYASSTVAPGLMAGAYLRVCRGIRLGADLFYVFGKSGFKLGGASVPLPLPAVIFGNAINSVSLKIEGFGFRTMNGYEQNETDVLGGIGFGIQRLMLEGIGNLGLRGKESPKWSMVGVMVGVLL